MATSVLGLLSLSPSVISGALGKDRIALVQARRNRSYKVKGVSPPQDTIKTDVVAWGYGRIPSGGGEFKSDLLEKPSRIRSRKKVMTTSVETQTEVGQNNARIRRMKLPWEYFKDGKILKSKSRDIQRHKEMKILEPTRAAKVVSVAVGSDYFPITPKEWRGPESSTKSPVAVSENTDSTTIPQSAKDNTNDLPISTETIEAQGVTNITNQKVKKIVKKKVAKSVEPGVVERKVVKVTEPEVDEQKDTKQTTDKVSLKKVGEPEVTPRKVKKRKVVKVTEPDVNEQKDTKQITDKVSVKKVVKRKATERNVEKVGKITEKKVKKVGKITEKKVKNVPKQGIYKAKFLIFDEQPVESVSEYCFVDDPDERDSEWLESPYNKNNDLSKQSYVQEIHLSELHTNDEMDRHSYLLMRTLRPFILLSKYGGRWPFSTYHEDRLIKFSMKWNSWPYVIFFCTSLIHCFVTALSVINIWLMLQTEHDRSEGGATFRR